MATRHRHSPTDLKGFKQQSCSICHCEDKFNFHIYDDVWKEVVPERYQHAVICLPCFDTFAEQKGIWYADAVVDLYFAGDKATLRFDVTSAQDV